jgi:hypothetical protein
MNLKLLFKMLDIYFGMILPIIPHGFRFFLFTQILEELKVPESFDTLQSVGTCLAIKSGIVRIEDIGFDHI